MNEENVRGVGSALFVGILLMIVGILNGAVCLICIHGLFVLGEPAEQ